MDIKGYRGLRQFLCINDEQKRNTKQLIFTLNLHDGCIRLSLLNDHVDTNLYLDIKREMDMQMNLEKGVRDRT